MRHQETPKKTDSASHILFVDDEGAILALMNQVLKNLGYSVTCHTSAIDALDEFSQDPDGFELVICDQMMPDMTGLELAGRVKQARPKTPVILCTGYLLESMEKTANEMKISAFIGKPFAMKDVARTIKDVLDDSQQFTF